LQLSVSDCGDGIPEEFRGRIFGKFEQADASSTRAKGGTGLGLSIVKSIVEKLGGVVSFDTKQGKGTTFHIELPEARARNAPVDDAMVGAHALDDRMRVLIVEDEADVSTVIAALLDAEGFSSDVAPDVASAKALLESRGYAAMTLDVRLAGESGIQLFRDLRASPSNADIPVIVISAIADEAKRSLNGAAIGIVDWLEKPVDPERLHVALGKIINRRLDRRPRILHVEDDEGVLAVMTEGLGSDVSIIFARSLQEASCAIADDRFDLVILDIALPDGSGLDLLSNLPAETAVIVFSAVDFDRQLGDRVKAVMTKTKASELDVAQLVRSFLPAGSVAAKDSMAKG
jgi:DNA-binding response OmpR family regulator